MMSEPPWKFERYEDLDAPRTRMTRERVLGWLCIFFFALVVAGGVGTGVIFATGAHVQQTRSVEDAIVTTLFALMVVLFGICVMECCCPRRVRNACWCCEPASVAPAPVTDKTQLTANLTNLTIER